MSLGVKIVVGASSVVILTICTLTVIHFSNTENSYATSSGGTITVVSTSTKSDPGSKNTFWNHNVTSGSDRLLIVGVTTQDKPVTTVTYHGNPMTLAGSISKNSMTVYLYYMFSPDVGNYQVKVKTTDFTDIFAGATLLSGVSSSTSFSAVKTSGHSSSPSSGAFLTSSTDFVFSVLGTKSKNPSPSASATEVYETGGSFYSASSMRLGVSPSVVMSYSMSSSETWGMVTIGLIPATTLPVTWKSFDLKLDGDQVTAEWVTASEINNDRFELEKAYDGISFTAVASVRGTGNSTFDNYYTASDPSKINELTYYRVKQIDYDGKFDYSEIKVVNPNIDKQELVIFPTVVSSFINVQYQTESKTGEALYRIVNYNGQEVVSGNLSSAELANSIRIDLPNFPAGNYILLLESNGKILGKGKFIRSSE